jgi:hypothetical protein
MSSCNNGGTAAHAEAIYGGIGHQMRNPITGGINETATTGTYVGGSHKKKTSKLYKPWYEKKKGMDMEDNYYLDEKAKKGKKRKTKRKSYSGLAFFRNIIRRNKSKGKKRRMRGGNCGCSGNNLLDTTTKVANVGAGNQQDLKVGSLL